MERLLSAIEHLKFSIYHCKSIQKDKYYKEINDALKDINRGLDKLKELYNR